MKVTSVKNILKGPINGSIQVTYDVNITEKAEFNRACKIITSWNNNALKAAKLKMENADWTMFEHSISDDKIIITIHQGACG